MNIVVPIHRVQDAESLVAAGADELYCGVFTKDEWCDSRGSGCVNHRSEVFSNLNDFSQLRRLVKKAHDLKIPLSLVLNEFYDDDKLCAAMEQVKQAYDCGVDAVIISDIGLLRYVREKGYDVSVHISSCANVFNSHTRAFYKNMGASRIILPRQLTREEIGSICAGGGMEIEVFILNERCFYVDGFCRFQHGNITKRLGAATVLWHFNMWLASAAAVIPRKILQVMHRYVVNHDHACCFPYGIEDGGEPAFRPQKYFNDPRSFLYACGACALRDLKELKVSHVKICGRSMFTERIRNIRFVKDAIALSEQDIPQGEFVAEVRGLAQKYRKYCGDQYCYYR
ncbi:MAG: U32 family peptidase [Candidatus Omnitrophica bacterium]|nr:U32 family peptidase [Candidatus Omnitrophota bacterium]